MPLLGLASLSSWLTPLAEPQFLAAISLDFDLSFLLQMVVFASLAVLLKGLLYDRVLKVFEERERRTDGAKAEARAMQERAGELLKRYEAELDRVNQVAAEERDRMRAETAKLEAQIMNEAREQVAKIVEQGRGRLNAEVQQIEAQLGQQSAVLANQIASKILGRELS